MYGAGGQECGFPAFSHFFTGMGGPVLPGASGYRGYLQSPHGTLTHPAPQWIHPWLLGMKPDNLEPSSRSQKIGKKNGQSVYKKMPSFSSVREC